MMDLVKNFDSTSSKIHSFPVENIHILKRYETVSKTCQKWNIWYMFDKKYNFKINFFL